ncbi:hypothetical protein ABZ714_17105 [Streptomyces sp. NPDC006798]|uniref:hypothetical protein n=1 Tax=Streptomyces sp. NPDC006798 TaxID=3155462 RepID=UPI0033EA1C56
MPGFEEAARARVRQARAELLAAREAGDAVEEAWAADELADALRTVRDHGLEPDDGPAAEEETS